MNGYINILEGKISKFNKVIKYLGYCKQNLILIRNNKTTIWHKIYRQRQSRNLMNKWRARVDKIYHLMNMKNKYLLNVFIYLS